MRPLFSYSTVIVALVFSLGSLQSLAAPRCTHHNTNTPKLKESVPPPHKWIDLGRAPPAQAIPLRIALPQTRFDELERHLYETSDPSHARYGQHLLKEQVEELVKPPSSSVDAVDAWLSQYGITRELIRRSPAGDWITVNVPVMLAEEMLDTVSFFHLGTTPFYLCSDIAIRLLRPGISCVEARCRRRCPHPHDAIQSPGAPALAHRARAAHDVLWPL